MSKNDVLKLILTFLHVFIACCDPAFGNHGNRDEGDDGKIKPAAATTEMELQLKGIPFKTSKNETNECPSDKSSSGNVTGSTVIVSCLSKNSYAGQPVEIVNASRLASIVHVVYSEPNVTSRMIPGNCVIALFYSPSCPFSCMAAPHFNALPRFFPDLKMIAIDAIKHRSMSAQFGIVGTPTLMLFHNGRPVAKFNETFEYSLDFFTSFIVRYTGIQPNGKLLVMSADFGGPVPSIPTKETDYYLLLSWLAIGARILYSFYYSEWGRNLMDATLNAWREAEAHHHRE